VGKRRTLLIVAAFVGLAILLAVLLPYDDEPRYKGQTLGEWVKAHDYARSGTARREATDAIIVITTNSVPVLVRWLSWDPAPQETLANKLPDFISYNRFLGPLIHQTNKLFRLNLAMKAFMVSETNAICAIPALTQLITNRKSWFAKHQALYALSCIGPLALPSIRQGINDPNPKVRYHALRCITGFGTNAVAAIPNIVRTLSDPDEVVRVYATNAVANIAPELLSKSPAQ
jgi:hypothetical protein